MLNAQSVLPSASASGLASAAASAQIGVYLKQLLLDFEPRLTPSIDHEDNRLPEPPRSVTLSWLVPSAPESKTAEHISEKALSLPNKVTKTGREVSDALIAYVRLDLDDTAYIKLPLDLLQTCAYDLVLAERILSNPSSSAKAVSRAEQLSRDTLAWLDGAPAPFTFQSCIQLLEEELFRSSNGHIQLQSLTPHIKAIANWIKNDPQVASEILEGYESRFRDRPEHYEQTVQDSMARANRRERPY